MITLPQPPLARSDYNKLIAKLLSNFEADRSSPYFDSKTPNHHVTIGRGFDIEPDGVSRKEVFQALRLNDPSLLTNDALRATEKAYVARIVAVLTGPDTTDTTLQTALDQVMAQRAADTLFANIAPIASQTTFSLTPTQIEQVFTAIIEEKEGVIDRNIANRNSLPLSAERAVLVSMAYQGLTPARSAALKAAIVNNSNRAEAWYLIRYEGYMGATDGAGQSKRHYAESQAFGLYGNASSVSANESKQVFGMLAKNRDAILAYESKFGVPPDNLTSDIAAIGIAAANADYRLTGTDQVQTLTAALKPARDAFIAWLNTQLPVGETALVATDWNPAAIAYNGPDKPLPTLDTRVLDGKGNNMDKNLLVGSDANDTLLAGKGNDVLIGGQGDDFIAGGSGDDTMYGGEGDDTYVIDLRDGPQHDRIFDSDNRGRIIVIDASGNALNTINFNRQGTTNTWTDSSGQVTISHNSPWRIALSDGSVIELGEDFNPTGFDINLQEAAAIPTVAYTGDIAKQVNGTSYTLSPTGYTSSGAEANAADVLNGTAAGEALTGLGGNDGLSGGAGDDLVEGGDGDDLLLGGTGADTINGGNGNDFIFGSAMGLVSTPTPVNFTPPSVATGGMEAARGFSWVAGRAAGQRWNGDTATLLGVAITGANVEPTFLASDGFYYVENTGNVIDAGAGDDYVGAGAAADVVHGGDGDDDIYGMGGADVLFGDAGSDFIEGDGGVSSGMGKTTPPSEHGADIIVGGAGRDVLLGQGGNDELFGGTEDDQLWGDDPDLTDTPLSIHGNDYLDGGDGRARLEGGGKDDGLFGSTGNDTLWGDNSSANAMPASSEGADCLDGEDGNDQLAGGGGDDELFGGTGNDLLWGDSAYVSSNGAMVSTGVATQGRDYLDGGEGKDILFGAGGADQLFGGMGKDGLCGDASIDDISLDMHRNALLDGGDLVNAGNGNDVVAVHAGNDVTYRQEGDNMLLGQFVALPSSIDLKDMGNTATKQFWLDASLHGNDFIDTEAGVCLVGNAGYESLAANDSQARAAA